MNLQEFKEHQIEEIFNWADELSDILTPDNITPSKLKDFPLAMETSERLKKICKWRATELKAKMQKISDSVITAIEAEEFLFKFNAGGQPVMKKKFATVEKRQRELRKRLDLHSYYKQLESEQFEWEIMASDWVSHINRLRREMRLLESEYIQSGKSNWDRIDDNCII